ncbi:hypothetical protein MB02_16390 [Croceicoccus estronivorus]|nr:hypothetical protein MB02_16390 [Croceicoccus estronivorus]
MVGHDVKEVHAIISGLLKLIYDCLSLELIEPGIQLLVTRPKVFLRGVLQLSAVRSDLLH